MYDLLVFTVHVTAELVNYVHCSVRLSGVLDAGEYDCFETLQVLKNCDANFVEHPFFELEKNI